MLWNIASRALALGTNVILDFGFWAREEREDYRLRAKQLGASSQVHFLDVSEDELMRRLAIRNSQPSQEAFHIPEEMMKPWIEFFQRPTLDELSAENKGVKPKESRLTSACSRLATSRFFNYTCQPSWF